MDNTLSHLTTEHSHQPHAIRQDPDTLSYFLYLNRPFRFRPNRPDLSILVTMANDREVLRLIWDGKIPICFIPDPTEIEVSQHPEPMFLMVSRLTYLPLVTEKVTKHFSRHVNNEHHDEVWFECNGQTRRPLKWNCPIGEPALVLSPERVLELTLSPFLPGILYDLFGKEAADDEEVLVVASEQGVLPWTITVHFGNAPADQVLRCPNREVVESQFMSALKEADFLKHRGQIISTMQKKDHSQLWLGLVNGTTKVLSSLLKVEN